MSQHSSNQARRTRAEGGFTLVELLTVMAILTVVGGLGVLGISRMMRGADAKVTETLLLDLSAKIEAYERRPENGDFPPTLLDSASFPDVGADGNTVNCGIESVVFCLGRKGSRAPLGLESIAPSLDDVQNYDEDRTRKQLTVFGDSKDLYEICDPWGTPIAYFHWRDYERVEAKSLGRVSGFDGDLKVVPWKNQKDGSYFQRRGFQLISAGEDQVFNTEDDITNFKR